MRVLIAGGTSGVESLPTSVSALVDWNVFNEHAVNWMGLYLGDISRPAPFGDEISWNWARNLNETTRRNVEGEIDRWIREGEPLPVLEKRLARLPAFSDARARMVAVTEVTRVYASGNLMAWDASGVVGAKRWRTARDELVCPICGPMHMTIVEFDQEWTFTPEMREADPGLDKALNSIKANGFIAPPAHVHCRCWLSPVIIEAHDLDELDEQRFDKQPGSSFALADELALIRGAGHDIFADIRPPSGRAPRGLGTEYKQRRRIQSRIESHIKWRDQAQRQLQGYRGQRGVRNRWRIDVAQTRVQELNKGITAMLDIANDPLADWAFKTELIDGIAAYISELRVLAA
jgi:hypothetical protein